MRVLFCDPLNTQNNFYIFTRELRKAGIDVYLAIDSGKQIPKEHCPEWHDSGIDRSSGDWIHRIAFPMISPVAHPLLFTRSWLQLSKFVRNFDLVVCSGIAPIWIAELGIPFVFFSYGSDLDQVATQGWSGYPRKGFSTYERLLYWTMKNLQVRSIRKAKSVVVAPYQISLARRLGIQNLAFLPHVIDTDMFKIVDSDTLKTDRDAVHKQYSCDTVLFHPPRQVWTDRSLADCKGNDKVIRAFSKFTSEHSGTKLFMVNKGWDLARSKELVNGLGIQDNVIWLDPMPKLEIAKWYRIADIVLDQFVVGVLALVAVEAMACGTPVVSYVGRAPDGMFYPEMPPAIQAHDEADIYDSLRSLHSSGIRKTVGMNGRYWVDRYCSPEAAIPEYVKFIRQVCRS